MKMELNAKPHQWPNSSGTKTAGRGRRKKFKTIKYLTTSLQIQISLMIGNLYPAGLITGISSIKIE